jgi:hypothetical protein
MKRGKRVSLLDSIDPTNTIEITDNEDEQPNVDTPPTSSVPRSSYSFRNRRTIRGKLVYDVKYHPMDDSIRSTQAAKRRSAHEEIHVFSDDTTSSYSAHIDSDEEGDGKESEAEAEKPSKPTRKWKKRARSRSQSAQPTRRSSRKTTKPRMSYNTSIHPQDCELEVSSTDDSDYGAASNVSKRQTISRIVEKSPAPATDHCTTARIVGFTQVEDDEMDHEINVSGRGKWPFARLVYSAQPVSLASVPLIDRR